MSSLDCKSSSDKEPLPSTARHYMPVASHAIPFIAWLVLMAGLQYVGDPGAWKYAVRTGLCLVLIIALRPWRYYYGPKWGDLPWGLFVGVVVLLIWVFPEIRWGDSLPIVQEFYLRFGILPLGKIPEETTGVIYAPHVAGWTMTLIRLGGSAIVIAVIEEFFWRGFLYRWLIDHRFLKLSLKEWDLEAFLIMTVLFGLAHNRWLVGMAAGAVYGLLMIRTGSIWSVCVAHIVTNLLLGIYVIATGSYVFW